MKTTDKHMLKPSIIKKTISLLLALTMVMTLVGCDMAGKNNDGSENNTDNNSTQDSTSDTEADSEEESNDADTVSYTVDKVVMTYVSAPLNVPSVVEKERGEYSATFAELGLGFDYSELTSGADQTAALASGDIQILNAVGVSSVILAAAGGLDIRIISMYSRAPKAFAMFARDDSLISPRDLIGKTIAGPKGTILHELLVAYLQTDGVTIDQVDFVNMDIPSAVAALEGGSVDVALAGGAAAYNLEKSGAYKICDGEGLISAAIVVATTQKFAEENPEIIRAFKDAQAFISEYITSNENEALQITADSLDMDIEDVRAMYPLYDFNTPITERDIEDLQDTEEFMYYAGMIDSHVQVEDLIVK